MDSSAEELQKVPPQQIEAEQSLLGGILIESQGLPAALEVLRGGEFYRDSHRTIFQAFQELFQRNEPIDLITTTELLAAKNKLDEVGGATYLASLTEMVPSAANVATYARIVHEKSLLRNLIETASQVIALCYGGGKSVEEILDQTEAAIFAVTESRIRTSYSHIKEIVKKSIENIERFQEYREMVTGVASHYTDLDKLTAGFQPSDLIIIAARPSMGKTALALSIARNVAMVGGVPVGVFSLEMSKEQLALRLLCAEARVDSHKIRTGFLSQQECAKMLTAAGKFVDAPMYIDDTPAISVLELRAKARRMKADRGLGLVIVDYLQLMQGRQGVERREQEISDISRSLKGLAKELNVPVIALSQLNRKVEERNQKRPLLSDLRESGAIEQDADLIAFIYRDEVYNKDSPDKGIAEIEISKHRNGPIGRVKLRYIDTYTRFENLALNV